MEKKIRREAFLRGGKAVGEGDDPGTGKGGWTWGMRSEEV
jgi:hypothetical protein